MTWRMVLPYPNILFIRFRVRAYASVDDGIRHSGVWCISAIRDGENIGVKVMSLRVDIFGETTVVGVVSVSGLAVAGGGLVGGVARGVDGRCAHRLCFLYHILGNLRCHNKVETRDGIPSQPPLTCTASPRSTIELLESDE